MKKDQEEIEGVFHRVVFAADDGSCLIGVLESGIKIKGTASQEYFIPGVSYRFSGRWHDDPNHGRQFLFSVYIANQPITDSQILSYVTRKLQGENTGIGPARIRKLLASVGTNRCMAFFKAEPEKVSKIIGVPYPSAVLASEILIRCEKFQKTEIEMIELLGGRGFTSVLIKKAIEDMGVLAPHVIKRDPFTLIVRKYPSAGFLRCDKLYTDKGNPENKLRRQMICLWDKINKSGGSVWITIPEAESHLRQMISSVIDPERAVELGLRAQWLAERTVDDVRYIAVFADARIEKQIPGFLCELMGVSEND